MELMLNWVEGLLGQRNIWALVLGVIFGLLIGLPFRRHARRAAADPFWMESTRSQMMGDRRLRYLINYLLLGVLIPGYCLGGAALCTLELLRRGFLWFKG